MEEFARFVEWAGGRAAAAEKLGCSVALVGHILNEERPVSKKVAARIREIAGKRFSLEKLLFGKAA